MGFFDMFDKLDDLLYEPVHVVCDYLREPIKVIDGHIENWKGKADIELEAKRREINFEIDSMIADKELERKDAIVDALKQYQVDLSQACEECVRQIGLMSLELRKRANDLVIEKTKEYKALQDQSKADARKELMEIEEIFADNERVRIRMEDVIIDQMTNMITTANSFIKELSEDMKRLNGNIDELTKKGQEMVAGYLSPIAAKIIKDNYNENGIEQK